MHSPLAVWLALGVSVLLHGAVVGILIYLNLLAGLTLEDVEEPPTFHAVGLVVKKPPDLKEEPRDNPQGSTKNDNHLDAKFTNANQNTSRRKEVPDQPPVAPTLPDGGGTKTVGPGNPMPNVFGAGGDPRIMLPSDIRNGTVGGPKSIGEGRASFFNIDVKGKRIVYVLDRSGSMADKRKIDFAKRHLARSLNGLSAGQSFLVIFYDENALALTFKPYTARQLIPATTRNIEKVKLQVDSIRLGGGTRHMLALRKALERKPDVIFFLTDADGGLDGGGLNEVRVLNRKSKTRIYCVKFGDGAELRKANWLKTLAAQTGGGYKYIQVKD